MDPAMALAADMVVLAVDMAALAEATAGKIYIIKLNYFRQDGFGWYD